MSILIKKEIKAARKSGAIIIEPYTKKNVSVNSVDATLSKYLLTYEPVDVMFSDEFDSYIVVRKKPTAFIDMRKKNPVYQLEIPEDGIILIPGILYLGSTVEQIGSTVFVPMYEGRSSMARLGIQSHISAGFGDMGFVSNWTLEITVVHPVKFYPGVRIGQVYFHKTAVSAKGKDLYHGKYNKQSGPQSSKSYKDFE